MKIIETENLTKKYKRYKKQEGLAGSIKGLFHREYEEKIAVDDFDIHVPEWMTAGMRFLPFYYVTYLPSMLFIGKCEEEAVTGLIVLGVWCMVFLVLNQVTYEHDRIKYDGAGI